MAPEVSAPEYVFRPLRYLRSVSIDWDEDGYERERIKEILTYYKSVRVHTKLLGKPTFRQK